VEEGEVGVLKVVPGPHFLIILMFSEPCLLFSAILLSCVVKLVFLVAVIVRVLKESD